MGITPTTYLGLSKQDHHDTTWHTALNASLDALDLYLTRRFAGNPNGDIAGQFLGQWCIDTSTNEQYFCTTTGNAATAVWTKVSVSSFALEDGTEGVPSLRYLADTDTGIYRSGTVGTAAHGVNIGVGGAVMAQFLYHQELTTDRHILHNEFYAGPTAVPLNSGQLLLRGGDSKWTFTAINSATGALTDQTVIGIQNTYKGVHLIDVDAAVTFRNTAFGIYSSASATLDFGDLSSPGVQLLGERMRFGDGTTALPPIAFKGDTATGIRLTASNTLSIITAGVIRGSFTNNGLEVFGVYGIPDGAVGSPGLQWGNDTNTGFYRRGADDFAVAAGGAIVAAFTTQGILAIDGAVGTPSIAFNSDTNTGFYRRGTDDFAAVCNGALSAAFTTSGVRWGDGTVSAPSAAFNSDTNTGLYSIAADTLGIACGGAESVRFNSTGISFDGGTNYLQTYEEGNFTPAITADTPPTLVTHDIQQGEYVRIGKMCIITVVVSTSAFTAAGNEKIRVTGLPFTAANNTGNHYTGVLSLSQGFTSTTCPKSIYLLENTTNLEFIIPAAADARDELDVTLRETGMSVTDNTMRFVLIYKVA